jgi:hypothetical protein
MIEASYKDCNMLTKNVLFLSIISLFFGCGVMSNPSDGDADTSASENTVAGALKSSLASSLYHLVLDDAYPSYKILTSQDDQNILLTELNTTLLTPINYTLSNLLAYPITMQEGCAITESIHSDANNTTITIQTDETACSQNPTNYLLFYKIDKTIGSIMIDKFDEENVSILNTKKL